MPMPKRLLIFSSLYCCSLNTAARFEWRYKFNAEANHCAALKYRLLYALPAQYTDIRHWLTKQPMLGIGALLLPPRSLTGSPRPFNRILAFACNRRPACPRLALFCIRWNVGLTDKMSPHGDMAAAGACLHSGLCCHRRLTMFPAASKRATP